MLKEGSRDSFPVLKQIKIRFKFVTHSRLLFVRAHSKQLITFVSWAGRSPNFSFVFMEIKAVAGVMGQGRLLVLMIFSTLPLVTGKLPFRDIQTHSHLPAITKP